MIKSALYQTITVSSGFFVYSLGFIQMNILTPIECFYFGTTFILLAVLRNRIESRTNKNKQILAVELTLRPSRLNVYNETRDFLHFCIGYWTKHCQGMVNGTNDLMNKIDFFKNSIKSKGSLNMPDVDSNIKELIVNAWRLQRLIDRLGKSKHRPKDQKYYSIEDNIHALVDWFAQQEKEIGELFKPYLVLPPNKSLHPTPNVAPV